MPQGRTAIPAALKRAVLVEAGHRCAIPTCKMTPVELAHIVPWKSERDHTFENLIALCPTCHTRYDSGQIDRPAMKQYKANLGLISGRYGEMERRILELLADAPGVREFRLPFGWGIPLMHLIKDGLLDQVQEAPGILINGLPPTEDFLVTDAGVEFVKKWVAAQPVSEEVDDAETE